jgi:hypothetical protein
VRENHDGGRPPDDTGFEALESGIENATVSD